MASKVREELLILAEYVFKMDTEQLLALQCDCKRPSEMQESGLFINRNFRFLKKTAAWEVLHEDDTWKLDVNI